MDRRRKAESRRQAGLDAMPAAAAIVAAIHAAMVLLIEPVGHAGRHDETVHALAVLGIALPLRQKVGTRPPVARLPGLAAIGAVEDAGGGDGDPKLPRILRVEHERMQDETAAA